MTQMLQKYLCMKIVFALTLSFLAAHSAFLGFATLLDLFEQKSCSEKKEEIELFRVI